MFQIQIHPIKQSCLKLKTELDVLMDTQAEVEDLYRYFTSEWREEEVAQTLKALGQELQEECNRMEQFQETLDRIAVAYETAEQRVYDIGNQEALFSEKKEGQWISIKVKPLNEAFMIPIL